MSPAARRSRPLVERDDLLRDLEQLLVQAAGGHGASLLLRGPAGIGKSAVLQAVAQLASSRGARVLHAQGGELERDVAYGVVRELLGPVVAAQPLTGMARLAAPVFGQASPDQSDVAYGLYWVVAAEAERRPVVLLVDDAHAADATSLRWLGYLERRLADLPVLLVLAGRSRDGRLDHVHDALPSTPVVDVAPLTADGVRALVDQLTATGVGDHDLQELVVETAGNPLLVRALVTPRTSTTASHEADRAAAAVDAWVVARLAELSLQDRDVLVAVAVLGRDATPARVVRLLERPGPEVSEAIGRLTDAELLLAEQELRLAHGLVTRTTLGRVPRATLWDLHRRVAALLEADDAMERAALHRVSTPPLGEAAAARTLLVAAELALQRGDRDTALPFLRRALREPPPPHLRPRVLHALGRALAGSAPEEALEALRAADALQPDEALATALAADRARILVELERADEAVSLLERALAQASSAERPALEAQLLVTEQIATPGRRTIALRVSGAAQARDDALRASPGGPERTAVDRLRACHVATTGLATGVPGPQVAGELRAALGRDFLAVVEAVDSPSAAQALWSLAQLGHVDEAVAGLRRQVELQTTAGALASIALYRSFLARALRLRLDIGDAMVEAEVALSAARHGGAAAMAMRVAASTTALVLVDRAESARAVDLLSRLEPGSAATYFSRDVHRSRAAALLARGDAMAALTELERVVPLEQREGGVADAWDWRALAVDAHLALGQRMPAHRLAEQEHDAAVRTQVPWRQARALRLLGQATGDPDVLADATARLADEQVRREHVLALLELGSLLRRRKQRRASREPLRLALDLSVRGGAHHLAQRARGELEASGARLQREVLVGVRALTPSERRIAALVADGLTNREVAQRLFVSTKTVESHLGGAFRKLGVSSRRELRAALPD